MPDPDEKIETAASTADSATLPLLIPEGVRYSCQNCGRCCGGWSVGMNEHDYENVKDVDWGALHPDLAGKELFVDREREYKAGASDFPYFTATRPDGTCSFLVDNLCLIHKTLGGDKKPDTCKIFPYTLVPTPTGIYVGVMQNSMAAVRNMGELLTDQRTQLESLWRLLIGRESLARGESEANLTDVAANFTLENLKNIDYKVTLVKDVPITWQDYIQIEKCMLAILTGKGPRQFDNLFDALLVMSELLNEAVSIKQSGGDFARLETFEPQNLGRWREEQPTFFEARVFNMLCYRNFVWMHLRQEYAAHWTEHNKSPFTERKVISTAVKTTMLGKMEIPEIGAVDLDKVRKMKISAVSPEIKEFLRRQIYLKIFSKTYMGARQAGLSTLASFNNLAGNVVSAIAYAKAHALKRGADEIMLHDLYEAMFMIDRETVSLNQLPQNRAAFYDMGFSSPRLFNRLIAQTASTTPC